MVDVKDRVPGDGKANRKKLTFDDGTVQYAKVEFADDAVEPGTPVNRELLMDLQGFAAKTTAFNADGSITETDPNSGAVKTTVFNSSGSITETLKKDGSSITKTTTFLANGNIQEVVS